MFCFTLFYKVKATEPKPIKTLNHEDMKTYEIVICIICTAITAGLIFVSIWKEVLQYRINEYEKTYLMQNFLEYIKSGQRDMPDIGHQFGFNKSFDLIDKALKNGLIEKSSESPRPFCVLTQKGEEFILISFE